MKKILLSTAITIFASCLFAQTYTLSDINSEVGFIIKNFGIEVRGNFKGLKGKISFDPIDFSSFSINSSVDATTINTGIDLRDNHLRKEDYFNVAKFPLISFVSTSVSNSTRSGTLLVAGNITMKGVTKQISFPFTITPKGDGYLLAGKFEIDRRDFGVGGRSMVLSDNVTVFISVFGKKSQ
jgi:polyisoprenoid-binding protein YceI